MRAVLRSSRRRGSELQKRLVALARDYEGVTGKPFRHFFCPILHRDEDVTLCKGHVVNRAFRGSARRWTVQRADVDGFFGHFESEFLFLQERGAHDPMDVLLDAELSRRLRPEFRVDGEAIPHFRPKGAVPSVFSPIVVEKAGREAKFCLKISPSEAMEKLAGKWDVVIQRDIRFPALVSLVKAAHLTMFSIFGYTYGASLASHFVGHEVLGRYFFQMAGRSRAAILDGAPGHFSEFANMVRPVAEPIPAMRGSLSDSLFYVCLSGDLRPWATIVLVRTGKMLHAVMLPVFEDAESSARYLRFLDGAGGSLSVRLAKLGRDHWEVEKSDRTFLWPEANIT